MPRLPYRLAGHSVSRDQVSIHDVWYNSSVDNCCGDMVMLPTVEGVYKNGRIELAERPVGLDNSKVLVTFLSQDKADIRPTRIMKFGMIGGDGEYGDCDFAAARATVCLDEY